MSKAVSIFGQKIALTTSLVGIFLICAPIPMGLRLNVLSYMAGLGILWLVFHRHISLSGWKLPFLFLMITTIAAAISVMRGAELSYFQFLRGAIFPILLVFLLCTKITQKFMLSLESLLPVITVGALMSAFLYFAIGSDLYNSSLDIPYDEAVYKRFFVYPIYLFLLLFVDAAINNRKSQIPYGLLLIASGSKAIFLSILLVYLFILFSRFSVGRFLGGSIVLVFIAVAAYYFGLYDRVADFMVDGDPWRVYEPLAAIDNLMDPIRFFIGNGSGIPYWDGRALSNSGADESLRVMINALYDVHNGFLAVALKFGVPLMLVFTSMILKASWRTQAGLLVSLVVMINIFLSHGSVQVAEAVGLALGLRLLMFRAAEKKRLEAAQRGQKS
jgi:hypothetical protein